MAFVDVVTLTGDGTFKGRVKAALVTEAMALCSRAKDDEESDFTYRKRVRFGMSIALEPEKRHDAMVWMVAATPSITSAATDTQIQNVTRAILAFLVNEA